MEEYTSDEGNYSSISSASGFSAFDDETEFKGYRQHIVSGSTDAEKHLLLQIDKYSANIWNKPSAKTNQHDFISEKINHEFGEQYRRLEKDKKDLMHQNEVLQIEINQLKNERGCKESCITHLKQKIGEQQANIHDLTQQNFKLNIDLSHLNNDLVTTKGMVDWYKKEWNSVNHERNGLQKEVFLIKNSLRNKKLEITRLGALLSDLSLKNSITIQENPETILSNSNMDEIQSDNNQHLLEYYLKEIADLNQELTTVKKSFMQQSEVLATLIKEKSEIVQGQTVLQKDFEKNNILLVDIQEKNETLKNINEDFAKTINEKDKAIFDLKTQLNSLNIQLEASSEEKVKVQESINAIRQNFHKMVAMQDELKNEMKAKSKMVLNLERKLQDTFMYDNWNKCAIEGFEAKENSYLNKINLLEEEIVHLKCEIDAKQEDSSKMILEFTEMKKYSEEVISNNVELKDKLNKLNMEKQKIEMCKSEEMKKLCCKFGLDFDIKSEIDEVINGLELHLTSKCQSVALTSEVMVEELESRCIVVAKKYSAVELLNSELSNEIKRLNDVLHLKEVELSRTQKRYERYYHTLLKNAKQHKMAVQTSAKDNNELKIQLLGMVEELNSRKLEICQYEIDKSADKHEIAKKTTIIERLKDVIKLQEDVISEKDSRLENLQAEHQKLGGLYEVLNKNYEELVSTHSKCLSTIETVNKVEQVDLDNQKCTIVNTQHELIEKLENEKINALKLIATLERLNRENLADIQALLADKTFLQRLIIDMKSTLNASAAKQFVDRMPLIKPMDLSKYNCPQLKDEAEILRLCASFLESNSSQESLRDLHNNVNDLKKEVFNMKSELGEF